MKHATWISMVALCATVFGVACSEQARVSRQWNEKTLMAKGDSTTTATFDTMRKALNSAAATQGFHEAVAFCQVAATGITAYYDDSTCTVRRVTNKPRNTANKMDEADSLVFLKMQQTWMNKQPPTNELVLTDAHATYYKPIIIQPLCLNCHGEPVKDIQNLVLTTLDSLYPEDQARFYKTGDLRGMWKVRFSQ